VHAKLAAALLSAKGKDMIVMKHRRNLTMHKLWHMFYNEKHIKNMKNMVVVTSGLAAARDEVDGG